VGVLDDSRRIAALYRVETAFSAFNAFLRKYALQKKEPPGDRRLKFTRRRAKFSAEGIRKE
jgi:hypothetical protein